jgi:hypothetical protein
LRLKHKWALTAFLAINIFAFSSDDIQARNSVYYEPEIQNIIKKDCGRCHSGVTRNLMDYDSLNAYAASGMLAAMVQGPMRGFAGSDVQAILDWIRQGAPEKPAGQKAGFLPGPGRVGPKSARPGFGAQAAKLPGDQITYNNTIKYILKQDCLRCHSGKFRNLTTYVNVKRYADSGLLETLVRRGGPMHRFAGPDSRLITAWVHRGAA